jgi:hypothetical protein
MFVMNPVFPNLNPYPDLTPLGGSPGVNPAGNGPHSGTADQELEALKQRLLGQALETAAPTVQTALRRAANEAASLAWLEPFPLLVFPTLFAECTRAARRRIQKQAFVQARSADLLEVAA